MTSIIIPTLNAGKGLARLLEGLRAQTVSSEILVIDSSSEDNTIETASSFGSKTIVIRRDDFDHGGTRTIAGKAATGDLLVYLTQDALPADAKTIENLLMPFQDQNVAASFGRQLPDAEANPFAAHLRLFNYPDMPYVKELSDKAGYGIKTPFLSNSCAAYRRSALEEIGWFKEGLIMGEDADAGARILLSGHKIAYAASATVYHSHNYTALDEFRRYFDIGVFHSCEALILREFGGAAGEGMAYVRSSAAYLYNEDRLGLMPELVMRTALKFIGYNLGLMHAKLPHGLARRMSMHKNWWDKNR